MAEDPEVLQNTDDTPQVIVVAVDTSNSARRILAMAARIARSLPESRLHVVHVFRHSRMDKHVPNSDAMHDAKESLEAHVRSAKRQCRNEVQAHFYVGDPTGEVLKACTEWKADLLVIGTHDYKGFERFLLGSIAETLMRKVGCSVLIVRPTAHH